MKPSGIGGMAVIEGVMMKNKKEYAIAVRKPDNEIVVEKSTHTSLSEKIKFFKLPIFRGMLAFVDSLVIGVKVLNFAASFFEEDEENSNDKNKKIADKSVKDNKGNGKNSKSDKKSDAPNKSNTGNKESEGTGALMMAAAVFISIIMSIAFFILLPFGISRLLTGMIHNSFLLGLIEGILRFIIFFGYIIAISQMKDIKRVFMYHGAEHKTINCLENGLELKLENVKGQSKQNKRCGTSFMLYVLIISIIFFSILPSWNVVWRIVSRIVLVPIIAGISYEFIQFTGKHDNKIMNALSKPGLWMQGLTTREPDEAMIEVAIQSVDAVFDWKSFLETAATSEEKEQKDSKNIIEHRSPNPNTTKQKESSLKKTVVPPVRPVDITTSDKSEEEDDEILKALDKYLDYDDKTSKGTDSKK